jgi:hypothetical protein
MFACLFQIITILAGNDKAAVVKGSLRAFLRAVDDFLVRAAGFCYICRIKMRDGTSAPHDFVMENANQQVIAFKSAAAPA